MKSKRMKSTSTTVLLNESGRRRRWWWRYGSSVRATRCMTPYVHLEVPGRPRCSLHAAALDGDEAGWRKQALRNRRHILIRPHPVGVSYPGRIIANPAMARIRPGCGTLTGCGQIRICLRFAVKAHASSAGVSGEGSLPLTAAKEFVT